jgi:hypothetical protein
MSATAYREKSKFSRTLSQVEQTRLLRFQTRRAHAIQAKIDALETMKETEIEHQDLQQGLLTSQEAVLSLVQTGLDLLLFEANCHKTTGALQKLAKSHANAIEETCVASKEIEDCVALEQRSLEKLKVISKSQRLNTFTLETVIAEIEQEDLNLIAKRLTQNV